ncbi:MAG: hypothetical protein ABSB49_09810 [Polyangia bacterium]|jgi:hypothetical protein
MDTRALKSRIASLAGRMPPQGLPPLVFLVQRGPRPADAAPDTATHRNRYFDSPAELAAIEAEIDQTEAGRGPADVVVVIRPYYPTAN